MNRQANLPNRAPAPVCVLFASGLGVLFWLVTTPEQTTTGLAFLQWQAQTLGPMLIILGMHTLLQRYPMNPWIRLCTSGVIGATLFLPAALALDAWQEPETRSYGIALAAEAGGLLPPVLLSWLSINVPWLLGFQFRPLEFELSDSASVVTTDARAPAPIQTPPAFFKLLETAVQSEVVALKSELNYLQVHTLNGQALILYSLRDAIDELAASPTFGCGMQVHRSYWVNVHHIKSFKRHNRQGDIILTDGQRLPVSRRYVKALENRLNSNT